MVYELATSVACFCCFHVITYNSTCCSYWCDVKLMFGFNYQGRGLCLSNLCHHALVFWLKYLLKHGLMVDYAQIVHNLCLKVVFLVLSSINVNYFDDYTGCTTHLSLLMYHRTCHLLYIFTL